MRNGPIACFSMDKDVNTAIDYTILHSIITHFHPLSVIPCVLHTLLIRKALEKLPKNSPTIEDILSLMKNEWKQWKELVMKRNENDPCRIWIETIKNQLESD